MIIKSKQYNCNFIIAHPIRRIIGVLLLFISMSSFAYSARIVLNANADIGYQLKTPNTTYVIRSPINLQGDTITIPSKSILKFENDGYLTNGKIIGSETFIEAERKMILKNVSIAGSWNIPIVYSEWILLCKTKQPQNEELQSLFNLCSGDDYTHLYLQKGKFYVSAVNEACSIIIPSNLYWHNLATIQMLPTDFKKYSIVQLKTSNNVIIDGGKFIGDAETHLGTKGEWGHGIKCSGVTNITLKNLECNYCWGDGIDLIEGDNNITRSYYVNCDSVRIENVKCLYNRRQGISIEAATNVLIRQCELAHTGRVKYTAPGAGLDIEPWCNNGEKIKNIKIEDSNFYDNKGVDFFNFANFKMGDKYRELNNEIESLKCNFNTVIIRQSSGTKMIDCRINSSLEIRDASNILIERTYIGRLIKGQNVENLQLTDCDEGVFSGLVSILGISLPFIFCGGAIINNLLA